MLYMQVLNTLTSAPAGRSSELAVLLSSRVGINSTNTPAIVASEVEGLLNQDIPYFTVDPAAAFVYSAQGDVVGELVASPLELMHSKLARMGEDDLARQVRLVRSAFSATVPDEGMGPVREVGTPEPDSTTFADLAVKVGMDLAGRVSLDRFDHLPATWIGPLAAIETDRPWPPGFLGYDLYTGRLGVGLGMARGVRALGSPLFELVACQLFDNTASILSDETYDPENIGSMGRGAYTGVAGVAWALWTAGRTLERSDWCDVATTSLAAIVEAASPERDSKFLDVIAGVPGLFTVARTIGAPIDLEPLRHRVMAAVVDGLENYEVNTQSGFAHGLSGLLFHLATTGPVPDVITETLMQRLGSFWRPAELNWSTNDTHNRATHGWCHGRAGVTMGVAASGVDPGTYGLPDLTTLVTAIGEDATGYNITHCHGDLGNYDMLRWLVTHKTPDLGHVLEKVQHTLQAGSLSRKLDDPHSRYSLNDGLMVGRAGVLLYAAERIDQSLSISPTTLEVR
ncbi:lanthionine synthetase LanC family protein [Austwickia chelonae]|uniref:lanthionine synthetase LanC family protein n=1 Tax=Austwickia chelonae TaxID=100225 RepID=UPI003D321DCA